MRSAKPKSRTAPMPGAHSWLLQVGMASALLTLSLAPAEAAPLLPTLEPEAPRIEAADPAPALGTLTLLPRTEPVIDRVTAAGQTQDSLALNTSAMEAALVLDPAEEGREAVTQTLQESDAVRRILGSTLAIGVPGATSQPQTAPDSDNDGGLAVNDPGFADGASVLPATTRSSAPGAAPRRAAQQRPDPMAMHDVTLVQDDGPTLRTVAKSIVSVRRPDQRQQPQTVTQSVASATDDVSSANFSLSEQLLDSRMLGDALQTVVRPTAAYGLDNSFSIFGQGRFELQLDLSATMGSINFTEASTGASLSVPLEDRVTGSEKVRTDPPVKLNVVEVVVNFLTSTTGIFMSFIAGGLFLLLAMFRAALAVRR